MIGTGIGLGLAGYRLKTGPATIPESVQGLRLWFDPTDENTLYQSNGGARATSDGDPVGYWLDKSRNGNHAIQADGLKKPTLKLNIKNSKNILRFDGSNDSMVLASAISFVESSFYLVFRRASGSIKSVPLGSSVDFQYPFDWFTDNKTYSGTSGGVTTEIKSADTSVGYFIFSSNKSGTGSVQINAFYNGLNFFSSNVSGGYTLNSIGEVAGTHYHNGDLLEILAYDKVLSVADNALILNYLNTKWSIY